MNYSISNLFVVTLFVCLSVRNAASLKCYECETDLVAGTANAGCRDKLGNVMTRECSTAVCSIVINTQENGKGLITRSCGEDTNGTMIGGEVNSGQDRGQYIADGSQVSWSICTTDFCNWDITHNHRIRRDLGDLFGSLAGFALPDLDDLGAANPALHRDVKKMQCYVCMTNPLDESDTTCRQNMKPTDCYQGACSIYKFTFNGDEIISRQCGGARMAALLPKKKDPKNDKITRFGVDFAWSMCTKDLCNWGVRNQDQMMTLYFGTILCLWGYCGFFKFF